jgi:hypothetical protein
MSSFLEPLTVTLYSKKVIKLKIFGEGDYLGLSRKALNPMESICIRDRQRTGQQWLPPIIPAPQEAGIKRIEVRSQPWANSSQDPISKINASQKRAGVVAQGVGPESKPQYYKGGEREKIPHMKRSTQCNLKSRDKSDAATNQEHQGAPKA